MIRLARARTVADVAIVCGAVLIELLTWGGRTTTSTGGSLPYVLLPALVVVFYSALLVRARWPRQVFGIEWVHSLAGIWIPGYQPVVGLFVALHAVAGRCSTGAAVAALLLTGVPCGIASWNGAATRFHTTTPFAASFAAQFVLYAVLVGVVWGLGRRVFASERRSARALAAQVAEAAARVAAERQRLARELHDIVSSSITAMLLQAAGARAVLVGGDPRVAGSLDHIQRSGEQAMRELHRLLGLLREVEPHDDEDGPGQPGLEDLDSLLRVAEAAGVEVVLTSSGASRPLDRSVDLAAFRVVQEALTNVAKHGGRGPRAQLELCWYPDDLSITVDSVDGRPRAPDDGFRPAPSGFGLPGLRERVAIVGGRLEFGVRPGGFRLQAQLPVAARRVPAASGSFVRPGSP